MNPQFLPSPTTRVIVVVATLVSVVLGDNYRMLGLLARRTEIVGRKLEEGVVAVEFRPLTAASP